MRNSPEICPYQSIDLALGCHRKVTVAPVRGWVVTIPDNDLDSGLFEKEQDADDFVREMQKRSKWPNSVFKRKAWIHFQQVIFGEVMNRKCWTPR